MNKLLKITGAESLLYIRWFVISVCFFQMQTSQNVSAYHAFDIWNTEPIRRTTPLSPFEVQIAHFTTSLRESRCNSFLRTAGAFIYLSLYHHV
ncbi:MAG: hypothetical protein ACYS6K_29330 [Planctomycetota bacterium]|jgi:hypothetical protein